MATTKPRLLFACTGWPSGMIDVASWAVREGLAEAVVFQLQPGLAFCLDPDDRTLLASGPVHPDLAESFALRGRRIDGCFLAPAPQGGWNVLDNRRRPIFRIEDAGDRLEVIVPANCERPEYDEAIRHFAQNRGVSVPLAHPDRSAPSWDKRERLSYEVREALRSVGGQFILELIALRPHMVGFRVEAGGFDDVRRFISAVRLFSDAEIALGGPTATSHPREVLEESGADYLFAGEAEEPFNLFLRLARERNSRDRQPEVPGLAYRYGGRIHYNTLPADGYERTALDDAGPSCAERRRCLQSARRPIASQQVVAANRLDWSLLRGFEREFESLYFTGGRGCPGSCTFCAQLHGREVRVKPARQLLEEIESADARVAEGAIRVERWNLFEHADAGELRDAQVAWAAIYDEDFFLDRGRALEFFRLWAESPLQRHYRLSFQTNPCSLLGPGGRADADLFEWIDRLKPMVQLGAESFHPELLARWRKRHNLAQLAAVLDALDRTRQDYTVFILLTDFDTTPEELVENLRRLVLAALPRRRMRIASSPFTIPLYDSETRRMLERRGALGPDRVGHFTDYERPQPGWLEPLAAELADLADAELRFALILPQRDAALVQAMEAVVQRVREEQRNVGQAACLPRFPGGEGGGWESSSVSAPIPAGNAKTSGAETEKDSRPRDAAPEKRRMRIERLRRQAEQAMDEIRDCRFQAVAPG